MIVKINENNYRLVILTDAFCSAHRAPWHWFFGWRDYNRNFSTYRLSKREWNAIRKAYNNLLDIEAEKSVDC